MFDPTKPIPPGFHLEEQPTSPLVVVGGVVFGLAYGPALLSGSNAIARPSYTGCPKDRWLVLPLAGPFIASDGRSEHYRSIGCDDPEGFVGAIYRMDGVLQVLGAGLLVAGLLAPGQALVKDAAKSDLRVIPWNVGATSAGVDVVGRF